MKPLFKTLFILVSVIITLNSCSAQQNSVPLKKDFDLENKLNAYIDRVIDTLNINFGIGLSVVKKEQMVYEGYYGYANSEKQIPVTPQTNFYIASSTKSFTSLAMLMLEDKGILDLDKSLASYFSEGEFDADLNADKVNLRDLLYHTSGLENNNITFSKAYTGQYSLESLSQNLIDYTTPNRRANYGEFKYSNLGYNIIELILERELGKDWKTVVQEEVLKPLGMNRTSGNISDIEKYDWAGTEPYNVINSKGDLKVFSLKKQDRIMHAAGGLISTPRDMAKFLIAELNDGKYNGKQVFPKGLIPFSQEAHAKQERNFFGLKRYGYGYGWNIAKTPLGDTLIHHYGGFPGTHAEVSFMPEHGVGVSIFANSDMTGLLASYLIASYTFDYYAEREDLDPYYNNLLNEYKTLLINGFKGQEASLQKRLKRTWNLELSREKYTGTFYSKSTGDIKVELINNKFIATMGILKSDPATPFTEKNSMRFELIPNSGTVIKFNVENGKVISLNMDGLKYIRK